MKTGRLVSDRISVNDWPNSSWRRCCIVSSRGTPQRPRGAPARSDGEGEVVEGDAGPVAGRDFGGDVVVAAAQVLHEGMPGGEDPRGAVAFQPAHRPQPCFQPPMVRLDGVIRMPPNRVQRRGHQFVEHARAGGGAVGGDLGGDRASAQGPGEEPPGSRQVAPGRQQDVDDLAELVNGPVEVRPPPGHL